MSFQMQINKYDLTTFHKNWGWIMAWGFALLVLGTFAISASVFTTLISIIFLGGIIFASGLVMMLNTFQYWWKKWPGFFGHFIVALFYIAVGLLLMFVPIPAAFSITVLLAVFFIILGFFRIIFSAMYQLPSWGWSFLSGIVTLALGILILAQLPSSGFYIIGLFVGIDLLIWGWASIMMAMYVKNIKT